MSTTATRITFTAPQRDLLAAVAPCAKVASKRSPSPILHHLKISLGEDGLGLTIQGTDGQMMVQRRLPAIGIDQCTFLAPAKILADTLGLLPSSGDVSFTYEPPEKQGLGGTLLVTGGRAKFKMATLDAEDFPVFAESGEKSTLTLTGRDLSRIVVAGKARGSDVNRAVLSNVQIAASGEKLIARATNTHLAIRDELDGAISQGEALLYGDALDVLGSISVPDAEEIEIVLGQRFASCESGSFRVAWIQPFGSFPNVDRVFPADGKTIWTVDRSEIQSAVRSVLPAAEGNALRVRLASDGDTLTVSAKSVDRGEASVEVAIASSGPDGEIAINGRYLALLLSECPCESVRMAFDDRTRPMLIRGADDSPWRSVVMPMALA